MQREPTVRVGSFSRPGAALSARRRAGMVSRAPCRGVGQWRIRHQQCCWHRAGRNRKCCPPPTPPSFLPSCLLPSAFFPSLNAGLIWKQRGGPLKALSREVMMPFALEEGYPGAHWDWTGAWRSAAGKPVVRPMSRESRKLGQGHTIGKQRGHRFTSSCLDPHACHAVFLFFITKLASLQRVGLIVESGLRTTTDMPP